MSDELRANLVIWKAPIPPVEEASKQQQQGGKGKGGKAAPLQQNNLDKTKVEPERPLMRGNTVATYWELNRQVGYRSLWVTECKETKSLTQPFAPFASQVPPFHATESG